MTALPMTISGCRAPDERRVGRSTVSGSMAVRGLRGVIVLAFARLAFADAASFPLGGRPGGGGDAALTAGGVFAGSRAGGAEAAAGATTALAGLRAAGRGGDPAGVPACHWRIVRPEPSPGSRRPPAQRAAVAQPACRPRAEQPAALLAACVRRHRVVDYLAVDYWAGGLVSATAADPLFGQAHDQLCSEAQAADKTKRLAKRIEARRFCSASP